MKSFSIRYRLGMFFSLLFLIGFQASAQKSDQAQIELRQQAIAFFNSGDYPSAASAFSQLLSLNQRDSVLLYHYGASLSMQADKASSAITYLDPVAYSFRAPRDVQYYLGRSLMADSRFVEAASAFRNFLDKGNGSREQRTDAQQRVQHCMHAAELLIARKNIPLVSEKDIPFRNFFSSYEFVPNGGKVTPAAEQFLSKTEKSKFQDPVMFISGDQQQIYLAKIPKSAGDQTDIFQVTRQSNGQWSEAIPLPGGVNSSAAEDFVFLERSGKTIYFSSKGFNSIGGFDIFRSDYDFSKGGWSEPVNMGIPINTIGDDMLFVPSADGRQATYVTTDRAPSGRAFIRTVELPAGTLKTVHVQGFYKSIDQQMRRDARVTVIRQNDRAVVTSVNTDPNTGQYAMDVPTGEDYFLVVEGGGYVPHIERFELPADVELAEVKQSVAMDRSGADEQMQVKNYFRSLATSGVSDEQASQTLTSSYTPGRSDSTSMVEVKIGDKTIKVPQPDLQSAVKVGDVSSGIVLDEAVKDDVGMQSIPVNDLADASSISEEEDKEEVVPSTAVEIPDQVLIDVTDADLARLSLEDARDNREEAAELREDALAVRKQVEDKRALATSLIDELSELDSTSNKTRFSSLRSQADELVRSANDDESRAQSMEEMANEREQSAIFSEREAARLSKKSLNKKGDRTRVDQNDVANEERKASFVNAQNDYASGESSKETANESTKGNPAEASAEDGTETEAEISNPVSISPQREGIVGTKTETEVETAKVNRIGVSAEEKTDTEASAPDMVSAGSEVETEETRETKAESVKVSPVGSSADEMTETDATTPVVVSAEGEGFTEAIAEAETEAVKETVKETETETETETVTVKEIPSRATSQKEVSTNNELEKTTPVSVSSEIEGVNGASTTVTETAITESEVAKENPTEASAGLGIAGSSEKEKSVSVVSDTFLDQPDPTREVTGIQSDIVDVSSGGVLVTSADVVALRSQIESDAGFFSEDEPETNNPSPNALTDPVLAQELMVAARQRNERAKRFEKQAEYLQELVESMPEGVERDSLLALSYEFSSEATRQSQFSDRLVSKAKVADPDIDTEILISSSTIRQDETAVSGNDVAGNGSANDSEDSNSDVATEDASKVSASTDTDLKKSQSEPAADTDFESPQNTSPLFTTEQENIKDQTAVSEKLDTSGERVMDEDITSTAPTVSETPEVPSSGESKGINGRYESFNNDQVTDQTQ
ncbi:MAG: hypothetical protein ACKOA1_09455, partial [Bacteroidota bacterium]